MRNIYSLILLVALMGANLKSIAQCEPILRHDSSQYVFNGAVLASAKVGTTLYLGGSFTSVGRSSGSFAIVERSVTGNLANPGNWPKVNGAVNAIAEDGAGGWIIGGTFTQVGTLSRNRIAQINAAGQVTAWNPDANSTVNALYVSGTTLYVGGGFTSIGGQTRNRLASYNLITGLINAWDPNSNGTVNTITGSGATIYVGGGFTSVGGSSRSMIAALDAAGVATIWNPSANSTVNKIVLDGSLAYVGGAFSNIGGSNRSNAAAIDLSNGTATSWNPAPNNIVNDFIVNGTKLFVAGSFTNIGSLARTAVAEVDNNLGNATSTNFNMSGTVISLARSGNTLYVGGNFTLSAGHTHIASFNLVTNTVNTWQSNFNTTVNAIKVSGTRLYVGGAFSNHIRTRSRAAAIDLVADTLMAWNPNVNGTVSAIAANNTNVYLGGSFTTVSGNSRSRLAEVNSTTGIVSSWAPNPNNNVLALLLNGNNLYVGGAFSSISSLTRTNIAAYDVTSTPILSSWNPSMNGAVATMVISGTTLYAGGSFTTVGGTSARNRLAGINTSTGIPTAWNPNADGNVTSLATDGTNLYAAGTFQYIGSTPAQVPRLAKLDMSGGAVVASWLPFPTNTVNSISIDGSTIYAGGAFISIGGQARNNLAALNVSTGLATNWDPAPNNTVSYVANYSGRLYVGGSYTTISSQNNTPYATHYSLRQTAPTVSITGNNSICASTPTTFTATTDVVGASYQWKRNGINVGLNSATLSIIPANNDQIQVVITVPGGSCYTTSTATSNTVTVSVTTPITPSISISGSTTVCNGTPVTYTATTNVPSPFFKWMLNGNEVGSNSTTFTYTPANGDQLTAQVFTPSNGCFSATSATSNTLAITVNNPAIATATINTTNTSICAGALVVFTSTTNVTGATYQWRKNGIPTGATTASYVATGVANNDIFTLVVTVPSAGCFTTANVISNPITMTVTANTTATLSISGNPAPCTSASTTYTATSNVVGGTYQWKVNGINVGTNSTTYTFVPAANDVLTCVVTAPNGTCYVPSTITSNSITINPQSAVTPTATVTGSNNLCAGDFGSYSVATNIVGGSYQWKVNGVNVSTGSNYFYTPINGDVITCTVTTPLAGCYTSTSVVSNNLVVVVNNPGLPTISIAASANNICSGLPVTFTSTTNVTGGTYQWYRNGNPVFGAVNSTYLALPANNDVIECVVTIPFGSCFLANSSFSNPITMTIIPSIVPTANISASANNVCAGTSVNFTAATSVSGGSYQWKVNGVNVGSNTSVHSYSPVNGDVVTCVITTPTTGCFTAPTVTSNSITMSVQTPVIPQLSVANVNNVCEGTKVVFTATANVPGVIYIWRVNGQTRGTNSDTFSYIPANSDIVFCSIIVPVGCFTTNFASSQATIMKMTPKANPNVTIGAVPIAEIGSTVQVFATIPAGLNTYSIEWKSNGNIFATTTTASTSYVKQPGVDALTATVTPTDGCYTPGTSPEIFVHGVPTSVNNIVEQKVLYAFPNPFNDRTTVSGVEKGDQIAVVDMTGKIVAPVETAVSSQHVLTFDNLVPGSYLIRITTKDAMLKGTLPIKKM